MPIGLGNPSEIVGAQDLTVSVPSLVVRPWASPPLPRSVPWFPPLHWIICP